MTELPQCAFRAASIFMPTRCFYAIDAERGFIVIDPRDGIVTRMSAAKFHECYMREELCPPQVKKVFHGMLAYTAWKWQHEHPGPDNMPQRACIENLST